MISIKSFAKINLYLNVLNKRKDGYHEIDTLFQTISLYDILNFDVKDFNGEAFILKSNIKELECKDNLIYRAYEKLKPYIKDQNKTVEVSLEKVIPSGAGLGGGSSNAAVTLLALNHIYDLALEQEKLMELGTSLGADVPFFIIGGLARGEGIGEKLSYLEDEGLKFDLLLVYPMIHASTKAAYQGLNLEQNNKPSIDSILMGLKDRNYNSIASSVYNQFEESQFKAYPDLVSVKNDFIDNGAVSALMSGSGSSFFGFFDDKDKLEKAYRFFRNKDFKAFKVESLNSQEYRKQLNF